MTTIWRQEFGIHFHGQDPPKFIMERDTCSLQHRACLCTESQSLATWCGGQVASGKICDSNEIRNQKTSNKYSSQGLLSAQEAQGVWLEGNLLGSTFPLGSTTEEQLPDSWAVFISWPFRPAGVSLLRTQSPGLSISTPGSHSTQLSTGSFSP